MRLAKISKILLLIVLFISSNFPLQSQTIHWLTFIDTTDSNVGAIDVYCRQMLYRYFIDEVNSALRLKGYKCDIQDFTGYNVSPSQCKSAIKRLKITNPDDIVVFYYIGHGVRPSTNREYVKEHPFPQMCLAQGIDNEDMFIPLEWVDEQLSSKGARLAVTIGMCCNNFNSDVSIKDDVNYSPNYGPTTLSPNKIKRIQELFLNNKGHVIATSASPGQTSESIFIGPYINIPASYRDVYTYAIYQFFRYNLNNYSKTLNWDSFLGEISRLVDSKTGGRQTPIHRVHTSSSDKPTTPKPTVPTASEIQKTKQTQQASTTVKQGENNGDNWISNLGNYLSTLINTSVSDSERQALESRLLSELFAKDAVVRFLPQDSDTSIDKSSVADWLGLLSTNPNGRIINVTVVEGQLDTDKKIKSLKVREAYKN